MSKKQYRVKFLNGKEKILEHETIYKVILSNGKNEIEIWGDGEQARSFCYVDDCVEGINILMNSDFKEPLNIGSDRLITINDMADIIAEIANKKIKKN